MSSTRHRLTIYGNWSAYDELSDGVPLTEELAMRQLDELVRLRASGVKIDAYLMDAFWFDPDGGYRTWRTPNWPEGPENWLQACREHNLIPGLWFTANTLCHLKPAAAWFDSADDNDWGICCFYGGFLADYIDVLDYWYRRGIRIFKLDFADFNAAPPEIKGRLTTEEIRVRNIDAFRSALLDFRFKHPEVIFMGFNGFENRDYMDRTDRPLEPVLDLRWLEVFDTIYSGDPRPADVPAIPFWRSVDIYGDHTTRVLEQSGVPLEKIDNCGFMAGPTGTCYWRGTALWRGMFLLTLMRGGDITVLYGDLSLFDDEAAAWMAQAQSYIASAFAKFPAESFGGIPGLAESYGWIVGGEACIVVNPKPSVTVCDLPPGEWQVLFADTGFAPKVNDGGETVELGSFQIALLGKYGPNLGTQEDAIAKALETAEFEVIERSIRRLLVECQAGDLTVTVQQRDANGNLIRTFAADRPMSDMLTIRATQGDIDFAVQTGLDRVIWSGVSWAAAEISAHGTAPIRIEIETADEAVQDLDFRIWREVD